LPGFEEIYIPLLSYPETVSAWGLTDLAGGTHEWLEDVYIAGHLRQTRVIDGTYRGGSVQGGDGDAFLYYGSDSPWSNFTQQGFRLASSVPSPGTLPAVCAIVLLIRRSRRVLTLR